jgi:D-3-phosphoglycerate dehydrogenase / 2-oxoglutarate reductase
MPHVLVAGAIHDAGLAILRATPDVSFDYVEEMSESAYTPLIDRADALVIRTQPLTAATVARAGRLRIVSRHGVGHDAVDVDALNARGIALTICGDVNATSVAEHACMLILAASKRALRADRAVRTGAWSWRNALESRDLRGCNLLQIGYGRIGRHIARMMAGFGVSIRAFDPFLPQNAWSDAPATPVSDLAEGLAWADIVSVSVPGGDRP